MEVELPESKEKITIKSPRVSDRDAYLEKLIELERLEKGGDITKTALETEKLRRWAIMELCLSIKAKDIANMALEDYEFLSNEINEIITGKRFREEAKNSAKSQN